MKKNIKNGFEVTLGVFLALVSIGVIIMVFILGGAMTAPSTNSIHETSTVETTVPMRPTEASFVLHYN